MGSVNGYCRIIFFYLIFAVSKSLTDTKEIDDSGVNDAEHVLVKRQAPSKNIQIVPQNQPILQPFQRSPFFPSQLSLPQNVNGSDNVFILPEQYYPGVGDDSQWVPTTNGGGFLSFSGQPNVFTRKFPFTGAQQVPQIRLESKSEASGQENIGRTPRQQSGNIPIAMVPQNPTMVARPNFLPNPNQLPPGMSPSMIPNPNRPFQPDHQNPQGGGPNVGPSPIRPEIITVPLTNVPKGQVDMIRITPGPSRPQPRPQINRPATGPPPNPNPGENPNQPQGGPIHVQGQQQGQPPNVQVQPNSSFQPLIITPVNVSRPRIVIPPQVPGGLAPIQTPNGRLLLEPHAENFCDMRQFSDEQLSSRSLQRVEYFVANLSCSRYFFECAVGQTFLLNCTSKDQVYDINTVNCNFRRNVKSCPEYDHILHCTIREQCQIDQFACCATPQTCIPYHKRCDGVPDCQDGDDENNCPACEPDEFPCVKSGKCIKMSQRCNGIPDECFDQTNLDELNCQGCGPNKFFCSRSETCVDLNLRCNGVRECPRGEDELNCKMKGPKYLLCENQKQSVAKEQWCDGYEDCVDGSDEKYCIY